MWLKICIPIVMMILFISCRDSDKSQHNEFTVSGSFSNAGSSMIVMEELTTTEALPLDSIVADADGSFFFRRQIDDAGFYIIRFDQTNQVTLLIEPGEDIHLAGDVTQLVPAYKVDGSKGSLLLAELNKTLWHNRQRVDSLVRYYREHKYETDADSLRKELESRYAEIFRSHQAYVQSFIYQNHQSLASLIALYQYFGRRLLLKESEHFEYFDMLSKNLADAYPANRHVMDLKRRVSEFRRNDAQRKLVEQSLAPGAEAPEILLPDPDGNQIALSSLRGQVVLIDFWAAWCPPCRKSNEQLSKIYEEYHSKGFEIYAVSLDRTLEQWVIGVEEDGADWIQVSDLRFWNSPVISLYNVESIPHTVLLDQEGNILKQGVSPSELRDMLGNLLP